MGAEIHPVSLKNVKTAFLDKFDKNTRRKERYPLHFLATLTLSLLLVNGAFMFWPSPDTSSEGIVFDTRGQEIIQAEEIQQTRQEQRKPAPPIPAPPVVVPDDVVLDDVELEIADTSLLIDEAGTDEEVVDGTLTGNETAARADRSPSPVRIAHPIIPREAERRNIRAIIVVEVLIDERGRVLNSRISERYLVNKDASEREPVQMIGYGIEEAVLAAAEKHTFRPAIQDGKRVQSYTTLTFRIGVKDS